MINIKRVAITIASLFLLLAAAFVNSPQLYYLAALFIVLPWVSYLVGLYSLRNLDIQREVPVTAWEGENAQFRLIINSHSHLPRVCLQAWDALPRWIQPMYEEPPHFNIMPGIKTEVPYTVFLEKRGAYTIDTVTIRSQDPLGLFYFTKPVHVSSEILVYPVPQEIEDFTRSGTDRHGYRSLTIAAARGSGVDPDGVREYVPGDPLRRMHWKSTARTGKLNVIEFEESRAVNMVLALDLHAGSDVGQGKETTLEYLVRAAASLAQCAIRQGATVRLVAGDAPDPANHAMRGTDHLFAVLASLSRAEARDTDLLSARLVSRIGTLQPGTTLVVLTSVADTKLSGALSYYTSAGGQAFVLYADPRSFVTDSHVLTPQVYESFIEGLLAAQTVPFLLYRNGTSRIHPEPIDNVRYFAKPTSV